MLSSSMFRWRMTSPDNSCLSRRRACPETEAPGFNSSRSQEDLSDERKASQADLSPSTQLSFSFPSGAKWVKLTVNSGQFFSETRPPCCLIRLAKSGSTAAPGGTRSSNVFLPFTAKKMVNRISYVFAIDDALLHKTILLLVTYDGCTPLGVCCSAECTGFPLITSNVLKSRLKARWRLIVVHNSVYTDTGVRITIDIVDALFVALSPLFSVIYNISCRYNNINMPGNSRRSMSALGRGSQLSGCGRQLSLGITMTSVCEEC